MRSVNGGSSNSGYSMDFVETLLLETPTNLRINDITISSYVASWDDVAGVSGYRSQVVLDTDFIDWVTRAGEFIYCTVVVDGLESSTLYYHRVRSDDQFWCFCL